MASAASSALAGYLLSPFCGIYLEKLIGYLSDYQPSSLSPSSSDEAQKQQQLEDLVKELKDGKQNVKLMQSQIMRLFEKHKQNERVVDLHNKLKDVGYDIQDLESEMKYMKLEGEVQAINKAEEKEEADTTTNQISGKRPFPFHRLTALFSRKKRCLPASSQSSSLSTADDDIVRQVISIINQINSIRSKFKDEDMLEGLFDQIKLNGVYDPREHHFIHNVHVTTSSTNEREIYGRKDEIRRLIEFLREPNVNSCNVSVAPIVGMGGMGKTTLAQFVFNNREIGDYFDKKVWIYVSDHFDRFRITKEMVDSFCIGNTISSTVSCRCGSTISLELLEGELKRHLTGKKSLLVLDDVWSDKWQQLLAPLQSAQAKAIKIIVTCRHPTVLRRIDEGNKIILKGINDQDYWLFFLNCASAENNPELHEIGRLIVLKLMGSPLAAKTVGKLLEGDLTEKHWNNVLKNDLWKFKSDAHDIMPALALSYYHLPMHLQSSFAFCSVLPNHHRYPYYDIETLISMWRANGYISESGSSSKALNDIGKAYYHELQKMNFFDGSSSQFLKMHDLMHDLAQLVSHGETCIYESGRDRTVSNNVRHLFVQEGSLDVQLPREKKSLRTLLLLNGANGMSAFLKHGAFNRIRVLMIYDDNLQEFPDAITDLKHLQHLTLWINKIKSIPDSLCRLYQLRVLTLPSQFHSLIKLEILRLKQPDTSWNSEELEYHVNSERGFTVAQLRNMNKLRGALSILGMENIYSKEEAMKAKLKEKLHIKKLHLSWKDTVDGCKHAVQEEVLEGLEPHPNLKQLKIEGYMGSRTPSWLMNLQKLTRIYFKNCRNLASLPAAIGMLHSLEELHLSDIQNLDIECDPDSEMLPSLEWLDLYNATVSFKGMSRSSSSSITATRQCKLFPHLQILSVQECDGVKGLLWPICSALEQLDIRNSPGLDDQLPECLRGLSSLIRFQLSGPNIKTFPAAVMATLHALEELRLEDCNELLSLEGLQALPKLRKLFLSTCHKFKYWCEVEMKDLRELDIKSCHDLESLPAWLHGLRLLKHLKIQYCPKFHSLPERRLPSLETLEIIECDPGLMERCQREQSPEWQMIQHIRKRNYISDDI